MKSPERLQEKERKRKKDRKEGRIYEISSTLATLSLCCVSSL